MKAISKKSALNRMDWFDFLNYFIMLLVIVCTVFPLYYCAIVSISNGAAVTKGEVVFAPVGFDTTAYKVVFGNSQIIWDGKLIASCFDLVTGPGKVNKKHEMPATLVSLTL